MNFDFGKFFDSYLESIMTTNDTINFFDDVKKYNLMFKEDENGVRVVTNVDMGEDEYKEFTNGILSRLATVAKFLGKNDSVVRIKVGNRAELVFKYDSKNAKYVCVEDEDPEKKDILTDGNHEEVYKKEEIEKCLENENVSFAQNLKSKVAKDIEDGAYLEESADEFDVDYAIEQMADVYNDGELQPIYDNKDNLVGVSADANYFVDQTYLDETSIKEIISNEGRNVFDFVNRCISELGFSRVQTKEDGDTVTFEFYF